MEGIGSRAGRASARYGPTTFTGPVRKWKKHWVHVSTSNAATSPLRLRRWTPASPSHAAGADDGSATPEEPPRRKFRYTPIVVLEEQRREDTKKFGGNSKPGNVPPLATETISQSDDTNKGARTEKFQEAYKDPQHSSVGLLNLELDLNDRDEDIESEAEVEVPESVKASSARFWS